MDLKTANMSCLSGFYQSVFKVWNMLIKQRPGLSDSLHWLLKEPVLYGGRLDCPGWAGPALTGTLLRTKVSTLGHVVELAGPQLDRPADLCSRLGLRSFRVVGQLLDHWRRQLAGEELSMLMDYKNSSLLPDQNDPFPACLLTPDLKDCSGVFLTDPAGVSLSNTAGKTFYKLSVKAINKKTLNGRNDTPWRTYLGFSPDLRPAWRSLYKPPLTKKHAD